MDPEARVVVTATNTTDAAFRAADRNLQQFQRSARGVRSLLASFGVVFSARAFAGWIAGAVKSAEATGEYAETVKATKDAMASMKAASDSLALSIATGLVPAMQALTVVFTGWNRLISGADPFPFEAQIEGLRGKLVALRAQFNASFAVPDVQRQLTEEIAKTTAAIDELLRKQEQALGVGLGGLLPKESDFIKTWRETFRQLKLPELNAPKIELDELVPLDGLEDVLVTARQMSVDELLKPFPAADVAKLFEPMKNGAEEAAEFMGATFFDSFVAWMDDSERNFGDLLQRMAKRAAASALFKAIGSLFAKGSFGANFFGGARAEGGPVSRGRGYLVGERGPEFFMPGSSGSIVPAGAGGMTFAPVYNIDARGADVGLIDRLPAVLSRRDQQLKAEIAELMRRGRFAR